MISQASSLPAATRGFTLVELLVALVLGLMLSAGIVNIYLENKRNYVQDEEVARMQENARYALNLLKRELTMAGFVAGIGDYSDIGKGSITGSGCVSSKDWALDVTGDMFELVNDYDPSGGGAPQTLNGSTWTCLPNADLQDGSDVFSVKRTADRRTLENGVLTDGAEDDGQYYLRSYDDNSTVGWTYIAPGGQIDAADKGAGTKVDYWEYYSQVFFLRKYSDTAGDNIPSLCVTRLGADSMDSNCIVDGIEDMQIEVGIDSNDDSVPDYFLANPSLTDMSDAVILRVYLLVRSINPLPDYVDAKKYHLGSKTIDAKNDGFARRVFSTTVQMRNAKLPNA